MNLRWISMIFLVVANGAAPAGAACFDDALYADLLQRHTAEVEDTAGVRVDYRALRGSAEWKRLVESVSRCQPERLADRAERLAFWINAYNILAIETVVRSYPVESIRDIGSFLRPVWKRTAGAIGGRDVSLGEIEHEILRPLGEPRIHAAIVCASTSCPSLRREPYRAERLDAQLADALRRFLVNPRKGARFEAADRTLWLSPIFDWFEEDFEPHGGVLDYLTPYLPENIRSSLAGSPDPTLRYFDYDWSLNDLAKRPRS